MEDLKIFKGFSFDASKLPTASDSEIEQYEKNEKEKKIQDWFSSSGVGQKYLDKRLSDFIAETDEQKQQLQTVQKFIADVNNGKTKTLWLCGNAGTGKTFLASMIVRETMGHFCKSYEIADDLEVSRSFSAKENKNMVIKRYSSYKVLVIDEIGKFQGENEISYLFRILNERYEAELPTILVTNFTNVGLRDYLGKPLYDRFVENCTSLMFTGESWRDRERKRGDFNE